MKDNGYIERNLLALFNSDVAFTKDQILVKGEEILKLIVKSGNAMKLKTACLSVTYDEYLAICEQYYCCVVN